MRVLPRPEERGPRRARFWLAGVQEDSLRAVMEQAPRMEALAARYVERTRPYWSWMADEWRRLGTLAAVFFIIGLMLHAMFGANGVVAYRQKRVEMQSLQTDVDRLQKENEESAARIKALKSDPQTIEKEARTQFGYTRPGEVVYVTPAPPQKPSAGRARK